MSNPEIVNPYLRTLMAHELLGYRKSHWRRSRYEDVRHDKNYIAKKHACRNAFGRVDLHLRRHGAALLAGDPTPLHDYPASFAGH